jgi:hypothetical protein
MAKKTTDMKHSMKPSPNVPTFTKPVPIVFGWLIPVSLMLVGMGVLGFGSWQLNRASLSEWWSSVPGTILSSEIQEISRHEEADSNYRVNVRYVYTVDGKKYEGNRLRFGFASYDDRWAAEQEKLRFASGNEVQVLYDPENPSQAVLIKGAGGGVWIPFAIGAAMTGIGLILCIVLPIAIAGRFEFQPNISGAETCDEQKPQKGESLK